ncbi:paladin isoform X1 [Micractinium conductrix]|uniref:Paladin isoform X1 n=1 Tax=Micractinium conductrix TaxID=554055 RepID=A0A2P6V0T0_9CHLO|nr:paladin isoform X1 [Micractinium conductrix]|eukprot:PSC67685.1 paladin isoform X1 [Micractinium conductrix]
MHNTEQAAVTPGPAAAAAASGTPASAAAAPQAPRAAAADVGSNGDAAGAAGEFPATPHNAASGRPDVSAEEVVGTRCGDVLLRHTILKSDHFPGCQNMKLTPLLDGAPNFRQVADLPVYGVAIPTVSGLRLVLDKLGAGAGRRKVLWHNQREEPVVYINGKPFVVREAERPFSNLEYTGIDRARVEGMEARLKADVLQEAAQYGSQVLVAHEDDQFQVVEEWEPVTEADVQTPLEVYQELVADGYDVDYLRVPVTDEKAPKPSDFQLLIERCWDPPPGAALVFNCQMGRGRTTTGMVIASLLALRRAAGGPASVPPGGGALALPPEPHPGLPPWFVVSERYPSPSKGGALSILEETELKAGKFGVIRSLLRALDGGSAAKAALDAVVDACSAMQNLREAIASYRGRMFYEANDARRQSLLQVCLEYLERYFTLICFASYISGAHFPPGSPNSLTFGEWLGGRPELRSILERLLRFNPASALGLNKAPDALAASEAQERQDSAELESHAALISQRGGAVLGPYTILKEDHFRGCQSSRLAACVAGAPNFRDVPGVRVFGGAIATVDGVRSVLLSVGAAPDAPPVNGRQVRAVWHLQREEPVVYVNGRPYVLREASRPFKNLLEYHGIQADRLEKMEARLREDILMEAAANGGRVLVTRESEAGGGVAARQVVEAFEPLGGPDAVQTPKQVYEALVGEGYRVTYVRIPLTDGACPLARDFDTFYSAAAAAGPSDALIYTCQLGGGRTTMGMVVGSLLRMHLNGARLGGEASALCSSSGPTTEHLDEDVGGGSPRGGSDDEGPGGATGRGAAAAAARAIEAAAAALSGRRGGTGGWQEMATGDEEQPLDLEERQLRDGEYVAVRRFTRILERGPDAKATVDEVIDACGLLINLRTAIIRYRQPRSLDRFFRPEIQARHNAFQRGSAYLERYCMLIVFTAYLQYCRARGRRLTFEEWMAARPDVCQARDFIHQNPASALAPLPLVLPLTPAPSGAPTPVPSGRNVSLDEQRRVLMKRRGSVVGRRSILKSYTLAAGGRQAGPLAVEGVSDIRHVEGLPIAALGDACVDGLRRLLDAAGAKPGGQRHIVVTDLREELVLYVRGTAYLRRELEMPAAALHHAGIQAVKLEDLERRLRADMLAEAAAWGGKVLLHREVATPAPTPLRPLRLPTRGGGGARGPPGAAAGGVAGADAASTIGAATDGEGGGGDEGGAGEGEDITRTTQYQPTSLVQAFWETTGDVGDIDQGLCTPREVFVAIAAEGYQISYRRVPMSRERTPQAADLDQLQAQMGSHPAGKEVMYVFLSRTAAGSSARFAAAAAATYLQLQAERRAAAAAAATLPPAGVSPRVAGSSPRVASAPALAAVQAADDTSDYMSPTKRQRLSAGSLLRVESDVSDLVSRNSLLGEYRGIMNLCRVLPNGLESKAAVDAAINRCAAIGNLRADIHACKEAAEGAAAAAGEEEATSPVAGAVLLGEPRAAAAAAARRLGLHYLQRYFFLLCFRAYLDGGGGGRGVLSASFSEWVTERRELKFLMSQLSLSSSSSSFSSAAALRTAAASSLQQPAAAGRRSLSVYAGNKGSGGPFAPLVVVVRNYMGTKEFNQFRGKMISLHSQVIKEFGKEIGADNKQVQGVIRLAKKNGEKLGFLA